MAGELGNRIELVSRDGGADGSNDAADERSSEAGREGANEGDGDGTSDAASDRALVAAAIARERSACSELVRRLTPIVQRRVCRRCEHMSRTLRLPFGRNQILDLTQEVLLALFDNDAAILRSWQPGRGASLDNFVGIVAEREAAAILRSGRRSAWAETPTASDLIDIQGSVDGIEGRVTSREELLAIWHRLEEQLSPRGLLLFQALLVDELPIEQVATQFGMTANALYAFRSRVRDRLEDIRRAIGCQPSESRA